MTPQTTLHKLQENARTLASIPAYYEKLGGEWKATTWQDYFANVRQAGRSLIALGIQPGEIVTMLGFNSPEWVILDLAAMLVGGAAAGIYTTNSPSEVKYILEHSEAKIILLEDESQWQKVKAVRDDLPSLKHVVMMRKAAKIDDPMVLSWNDFLAGGEATPDGTVEDRLTRLQMGQLATLIYTSGTTGPPKAVMLSHNNLAWTAKQALTLLSLNAQDSLLSYLPLAHIAEQMFTIHAAIAAGYTVYFAEALPKVPDNLKEVQPTVVFGVPRVWERFYEGVRAKLQEAHGVRAKLMQWARGVGTQVTALRNRGKEPSGLLALQYKVANRLIFSKVKPALGLNRARYCLSGAAPLSLDVMEFFAGLDLPILEIYGQSEGTGPTTSNRPGAIKFGTVGQAYPGDEVKLAEDGEILLRGENVFLGYYKDEAATRKDLIDGWLLSGDLGKFDDEGYLTIIGRKKEIMITSGGKNIAPKNIEAALVSCDLIAEAALIADRRKFVSAVVTLQNEAAAKFAKEQGIDGSLHNNPAVIAAVQKEIDERVNTHFAQVEQVRKFTILPRNFSIETGELTPTQKLKRHIVYKNWANEIEAMYKE